MVGRILDGRDLERRLGRECSLFLFFSLCEFVRGFGNEFFNFIIRSKILLGKFKKLRCTDFGFFYKFFLWIIK